MQTANLEKEITNYEEDTTQKSKPSKIYCANCYHCQLIRQYTGKDNQYVLRVKCDKKMWRKKLGDEKVYKYFSVGRRTMSDCDNYEPMGELKQFMKDLRKNLPVKDEVYNI